MNSDIRDYVSKCPTCRKYEVANPAEPLMVHEVPDRPWAKVGVDLFKFADRDYLCTVNYMSNFWEIDHLQNTEAKTVITKLKHHFARHGIPDQVVTDNGPQFSIQDFSTFAKKWCFTHTPVSLYNSKANGKVESAVKMAKNLFRKAREDKADPYLAMLDHRNTPAKGLLSPAQKLMSRRTKTLLPTREDLLKPELPKNIKKLLKRDSRRQERSFNHKVRPLQPLYPGDVVRMKPHTNGQKEWKKAIVWRTLDERSYHVKVVGEYYRRNWVDLKKTAEAPPLTSLIHQPYEMESEVPEKEGRLQRHVTRNQLKMKVK